MTKYQLANRKFHKKLCSISYKVITYICIKNLFFDFVKYFKIEIPIKR